MRPVVTESEKSHFYLATEMSGLSPRCFKNSCDDKTLKLVSIKENLPEA